MRGYDKDQSWSVNIIQPIAISQIYSQVWPDCEILELDNDETDHLKKVLDIGGADKVLQYPDGTVAFLAQRFRSYDYHRYDDFTLRYERPLSGRKTEFSKCLGALKRSTMLAAYYCYGHVNEAEDGFLRFRIVDFRRFLELQNNGGLPEPTIILNRDRSAKFLAWPFTSIPDSIFFWQLLQSELQIEPVKEYTPMEDFI